VVHANARQILASYISSLPKNAHVICSGNFSIETTLRMNGFKGQVTGCDVSLYTCTLGAYFAGLDLPLALNADRFPDLTGLAPFLSDQEGRAAAVSVALDALQFEKQNSAYAVRQWRAYVRSLESLCHATRERLKKKRAALGLNGFHAMDGWDHVGMIPPDGHHVILTFPPTYAGGYEKLYARLAEAFTWEPPPYRELTSGREFAQRIIDSGCPWIIGAEKPTPELEEIAGPPIAVSPRGTDVGITLYSNIAELRARVIRRQINATECRYARLTDRDEISSQSRLTIHRIDSAEANYIRQIYASVDVGQAAAQFSYAVAVDGKLIGILLFQEPSVGHWKIEGSTGADLIYMMADIAVSSSRYPRLSKLVLAASLSAEMRKDLERRTIRSIAFNATTAFSRNPASMKYRSLFELYSRKEENGLGLGLYKLNYVAPMGRATLQQALTKWHKQHLKPAPAPVPVPVTSTN
jgi:hypothetical protein